MPPPVGPAYNPLANEAFELYVKEYYDKHPKSDLVHPELYHKASEFLSSGSQVRDKGQPFTKDFRAWVRSNNFQLINKQLHKVVEKTGEDAVCLPVVTIPDVGKTIHAVHAELAKHRGQDITKKMVSLLPLLQACHGALC